MSTLDKARVLIVGNSETGKTSLSKLIASGKPCERPMSTIGCSTEVKLHDYRAGLPGEKPYFIELWDIGGSRGHENARSLFYNPVDGLILVYDLTNKKSYNNLDGWLKEVYTYRDGGKLRQVQVYSNEYDSELMAGASIPTLVVGTKLDLYKGQEPQATSIADQCDAEEMYLDCTSNRSLAAGSSNSVKLSRFFDKVIEKKLNTSVTSPAIQNRDMYFSQDRKRTYSPSRTYGSKNTHID